MRSPFPGMDPYLEDQGRWADFHGRLITYCCDIISQSLPNDYVAQMGEEVRVVTWQVGRERTMRPDVAIVRGDRFAGSRAAAAGSVATLPQVDTLEPVEIPFASALDEVRETWIEIRRLPEERLVTAIEILSPTNKGSSGLEDYLRKRIRLWNQRVNLVEIDLLVAGRRMPLAGPLPPGDCYAVVLRAGKPDSADVFAWSIRRPLPSIPIPLEPPDADVHVDLGALFATAYERGRYGRLIDYSRPLDLPLRPRTRSGLKESHRPRPARPDDRACDASRRGDMRLARRLAPTW
jgi:hypothetical protein